MKVKVCDPAPHGACCFYRSLGPLSKLKKINPNIKIEHMQSVIWYTISDADILFFERPQDKVYIAAMEMAKDFGIPVWIDFDDCLHEVPPYNPAYKYYAGDDVREYIDRAFKIADVVTVATPAIKEYYNNLNDNIFVVENAINDYNFPLKKVTDKYKTINWRGSNTHRQDLLSVAQSMFKLAEQYEKEWGWTFIGGTNENDLWYVTDRIKNVFNFKESDIITYHKFIKDLKPAIQLVPLFENHFNRCKSNIAWLEGTWSGAATLAPNFPEFDRPGILNYMPNNNDSFGYNLEKLIKNDTLRDKNYNLSFDYIQDNLLLSTINKKRIKIIEKLMDGK